MNKDIKQWLDGIITAAINNLNVINNVKNSKGEKGNKGTQGDKGIKGEPGERGEQGELSDLIPISKYIKNYKENGLANLFIKLEIEDNKIWFKIIEGNYYIISLNSEDSLNDIIETINRDIQPNLEPNDIRLRIKQINKYYDNQQHNTYSIYHYRKEYYE